MKLILLLYSLLLLTNATSFGQKKHSDNNQKTILAAAAKESAQQKFEQDLTTKNIKIYLLGGIISVITKEDLEFERNYKLRYYDFGCTPPVNFETFEKYNQLVFDYLLKEYGKHWISSTNQNAFGFLKWKENR